MYYIIVATYVMSGSKAKICLYLVPSVLLVSRVYNRLGTLACTDDNIIDWISASFILFIK